MKVLNDKVLIEPEDNLKKKEKETGIILPDHDNVLPDRGKVLEVGPKVREVKKGDYVVFDRLRAGAGINNSGHKWKDGDKEYYCIPESLVLAVLE